MKQVLSITIGLIVGAVVGSGTLFSASEPGSKTQSPEGKDVAMAQPVVHFEICGKDGKKTREFYGKLFGWQYQEMEGMDYGLVSPGVEGSSIGGGVMGAPPNVQPYLTFYIQVDDLQAYLNKAESLGGKTILPPMPIPNVGSCAMFTDPDGNVVGLYKHGA
jgi:predicted enzyme related to lactoylglutathione lyase